jgi:hypothetical protein
MQVRYLTLELESIKSCRGLVRVIHRLCDGFRLTSLTDLHFF